MLTTGLTFGSVMLAGSDDVDSSARCVLRSTAADLDGNTYMAGYVTGTIDFDLSGTHAGDVDIVVPRGDFD